MQPPGPPQHRCDLKGHVARAAGSCDTSIWARFQESVAHHGGCTAISECGRITTYDGLASRAAGVRDRVLAVADPGEPVGVLMRTSSDAVATVLGVLAAGRAFAPLDLLDPPQRLAELCALAGVRVVVTDIAREDRGGAVTALTQHGLELLGVDTIGLSTAMHEIGDAAGGAPASIFFTSGSTGRPKAVLDAHRNILHNALRYTNLLEIEPADRLSVIQRMSFSGVASSIFAALTNGATLCPFDLRPDSVRQLAAWVADENVTIFHSVPSLFRVIAHDGRTFRHVRTVRLEGDRATWADAALFRERFARTAILANGLGTTETGLAAQFRVNANTELEHGALPVGQSAPGVETLVVDDRLAPLPAGQVGEVAVRSNYLALEYIGAPDLTARRFRVAPDGGRLYLTGDLGLVDDAGRLVIQGRLDGTSKVGGVRVEPAEVEHELLQIPGVADATVTIETGPRGDGFLTALVQRSEHELTVERVHRALEHRLPDHMIPRRLEVVDSLAVDDNWKLSRRASTRQAARTDRELTLQRIWSSVLGVEVGIDDRFVDLGGDSLAATEVAVEIERELGVAVPFGLLARAPTIARLAEAMSTTATTPGVTVVQLRSGGSGTPVVLLPTHSGDILESAAVAGRIHASSTVWGVQIDITDPDAAALDDVAANVATLLRAAFAGERIVLAGLCYGALLTLETTRRLRADGGPDVRPVLYGLLPGDLAGLATGDAVARWNSWRGPRKLSVRRLRYHASRVKRGGTVGGSAYLGRMGREGLRFVARAARGLPAPAAPLSAGAVGVVRTPLLGHATLLLSASTVARYSDDPHMTWAAVAESIDVRVMSSTHDDDGASLLRAPGSQELADALSLVAALDQ